MIAFVFDLVRCTGAVVDFEFAVVGVLESFHPSFEVRGDGA